VREWISRADCDVKHDDATEGTPPADVEVADRCDFPTPNNDVSRRLSPMSVEVQTENLRVNHDTAALDRPSSERQFDVGDSSAEKISVLGPQLETSGGFSECGLGDAAKSSMSIYESCELGEAELVHEKSRQDLQ